MVMESHEPIVIPRTFPLGYVAAFILHTFVVYLCAMHLSQWLVFPWFGWIAPRLQMSISIPAADWYLQHFELVTTLPALVVGYLDVARFLPPTVLISLHEERSGSIAPWVWSVPTIVLLYRMLIFHAPSSVLVGASMTALKYFFDIRKVMPTWANPLASDPVRVWAQMSITGPFYAGLAYSLGALASKHQLLTKLVTFEKHEEAATPQEP
jgi:hypothetical protein